MRKNRLLAFLLCVIMLLCACSCEKPKNNNAGLSVVTTVFPAYDFARAVVKDKGNVDMLLPPGSECHSYEPSPQDVLKIQQCDLFIYIGGESEEWVEEIINSLDTSNIKILRLFDYVTPLEEVVSEGMQKDKNEVSHEVEYDEHIWTSPFNAMLMIKAINEAVCGMDKNNSDTYNANAEYYLNEIENLDSEFSETVSKAKRKTIVFADRFPFAYFANRYDLNYWAAFPGCSQETEPSASTVAFLIDKVKSDNITTVFYIEFSNERMADAICEETGAEKRLFHSCHNVSKEDFESGKTYADIMKSNLTVLKEALN